MFRKRLKGRICCDSDLIVVICLSLALSGCCLHRAGVCNSAVRANKEALLKEFTRSSFQSNGRTHLVLRSDVGPHNGNAPAILLLHEMPALSAESLLLGKRLSKEGYDVYIPLLFGSLSDSDRDHSTSTFLRNLFRLELTPSEWHPLFSEHRASGINQWLRDFCRCEIVKRDNHRRVGVIGMCLTGSFPLALMDVREIRAAVVSQPALPLAACTKEAKSSLGISRNEMDFAFRRIKKERIPILGFRFEGDQVSPKERFDYLREQLPDFFEDRTIPESVYIREGLPKNAHSVLTACYMEPTNEIAEPATFRAYKELLAYLEKRLKAATVAQ